MNSAVWLKRLRLAFRSFRTARSAFSSLLCSCSSSSLAAFRLLLLSSADRQSIRSSSRFKMLSWARQEKGQGQGL
jgi:hypothetical protein